MLSVFFLHFREKSAIQTNINITGVRKEKHIAIKNIDINIQLKIIITKTIQSLEQQKKNISMVSGSLGKPDEYHLTKEEILYRVIIAYTFGDRNISCFPADI